jgi:60 kDa SS-A/Ro ribonucleoprotein
MKYTKHFQTSETPQSQPIPSTSQVPNSAGGFAWAVDDWKRLDRFLILGTEGGSYYASEKELTIENAEAVLRCIRTDGRRTVGRILEISESGRAPKNNPAIFALAISASVGNAATRKFALDVLPRVARIGTHLFTFLDYVQGFRGWGRSLRRAVGNWYNSKNVDDLAYQLLKYRQRAGWAHRDVLRLSSPTPESEAHNALYRWVVSENMGEREVARRERKDGSTTTKTYRPVSASLLPELMRSFDILQKADNIKDVIKTIGNNRSISWEMVPTKFLGDPKIWEALLPNMPMTAMLRNLARMTANGLIVSMGKETDFIISRLTDEERIRKARIHPISILGALLTYCQGHGARGKLTWGPEKQIIDALDKAFYLSFGNVTPTGRHILLALDISGSMGTGEIAGMPGLSPRIASAALSLITASVEKNYTILGFSDKLIPLDISPRQRLDDVIRSISGLPFGGTDCALPMLWALDKGVEIDTFIIYTDNETWHGQIHPSQALNKYRRKSGIPAKLVVVGMVANGFSIADPDDAGMMDVVGFDTATPELILDFSLM